MYHPANNLEELNEYYFPLYEAITNIMDISTPEEIESKIKQIDSMYNHDLKVLKYKLLHKKKSKKDERLKARMQSVNKYIENKQQLQEKKQHTQAIQCPTEVINRTELLEEGEEDEE